MFPKKKLLLLLFLNSFASLQHSQWWCFTFKYWLCCTEPSIGKVSFLRVLLDCPSKVGDKCLCWAAFVLVLRVHMADIVDYIDRLLYIQLIHAGANTGFLLFDHSAKVNYVSVDFVVLGRNVHICY